MARSSTALRSGALSQRLDSSSSLCSLIWPGQRAAAGPPTHEEAADLVGEDAAGLLAGDRLLPDGDKLGGGVAADDALDRLDVLAVEVVEGAVGSGRGHELDVVFVGEGEAGEDLERGRGDAALVRRRVLEEDAAALLERQTGLLRDEQVGALDDVLRGQSRARQVRAP